MFRTRLVPFVILFFILLFPVEWLHASPNGATIRVGIFQNRPIVYQDQQGAPQGLYVDLVVEIAKLEGWDIEFVPGSWANCLERLKAGEIDLMTSIAYTKERDRQMDYSREDVLTMWGQVYVRSSLQIQTILDLNGRKIAILKDGINGINFMALCKKFNVDCEFVAVDSYAKVFELVASGVTYAGVANNIHGYALEKDFDVQRSPILFNPFSLLFAVPEGMHHNLLSAIDKHLAGWKQNRTSFYYTTLDRWFGVRSRETTLPHWVIILLSITGGITILAFGWMRVLKLQVKTRTRELQISNETLQAEITGRKRTEEELRKLKDELEVKIAERTTELNEKVDKLDRSQKIMVHTVEDLNITSKELSQANVRLKELDHLKSMFIASMSHELRTPLNSIIGFTGIMLQGMPGEITKEQIRQLTMIKSSGMHLLSLINDIIDVSKIEAGKVDLFIEEFDLAKLLQEIKDSFNGAADDKGLKLSLEMPKSLIIKSDQRRTKQIIMNLVGNAVKFAGEAEIAIRAEKQNGNAQVSVADAGVGIRKEDMKKLFAVFSRIHVKGTPTQEGTGLGLHLSKKIVDLLGGDIKAESEFGKGSKFTFRLPLEHKGIRQRG